MPLNKKGKKIMEKMKEEYGKKKGESVFYAMENSGKLKGVKKAKQGMMANLKPVPAGKEKSLGKLPTKVRNKMGYPRRLCGPRTLGCSVSDRALRSRRRTSLGASYDRDRRTVR